MRYSLYFTPDFDDPIKIIKIEFGNVIMLTILAPEGVEILYDRIVYQLVEIDHENIIGSIYKTLERIKYPRILLIRSSQPPDENIILRMFRLIRRAHAILLIEDNKALMDFILFNSTIFRTVIRLLESINWIDFDGLIRGLGKIVFFRPDELKSSGRGILIKPGKVPDKLNMFVSHYFWTGAYCRYLNLKGVGGESIALRGARAFESEGKTYELKGIYNIAVSAYRNALELYYKVNSNLAKKVEEKLLSLGEEV